MYKTFKGWLFYWLVMLVGCIVFSIPLGMYFGLPPIIPVVNAVVLVAFLMLMESTEKPWRNNV